MSDNSHSVAHSRRHHPLHLNPSQRGALASQLKNQHDDIMRQLHAFDQQARTPDGDDALQRDGAHEVEAKLSEIERLELNDIDRALARVHSQDYGVCVSCSAEIPLTRLQAEPQASRCIRCQTQLERTRSVQTPNVAAEYSGK